jgi:SAM-dependent methyltransferase
VARLSYDRLLLSDTHGQDAYRRALTQALRGGEVVLDVGTGTGIHAIFACQAGASKVYAVEQDDIIDVARRIAAANGYADRICFIRGSLMDVHLPEKVDVVLGSHGLRDLFRLLPQARDHHLKSGGRILPARVELFCAPVEMPDLYRERVDFWKAGHFDIDFSAVRPYEVNRLHDCTASPESLLGPGGCLASFDLATINTPKLRAVGESRIQRAGTLHGVVLWVTQWLTDSVWCSNQPPSPYPGDLWTQVFFPIGEAVTVEPGCHVSTALQTAGPTWGSIWKWKILVKDQSGNLRHCFDHSTVVGTVLLPARLKRQTQDYRPKVTARGQALCRVIAAFEMGETVGEIERQLIASCAEVFRHRDQAAEFVAQAIERYAQ